MSSQRLTNLMHFAKGEMKFYFVTKSGTIDDASESLKHSFQLIVIFSSSIDNLYWLSEAECLLLDYTLLTSEKVFVLERFEGSAFKHLSPTKAIVIGPRLLINCNLRNEVVPKIFSPIYTLAMKDFIVCLSGISIEKRDEIHMLVGYMGGLSSEDLIESTTHLITNTTTSLKYQKAAERKMKIVSVEWVFDMWSLSKINDDSYRTAKFYEKYKFPIFKNLVITSTGIPEADKNEIVALINNNGGTYSGLFNSIVTDIVIVQSNQEDSQKLKAAVKCRKECLLVDWVRDSASKGYMLPFLNYRIYTGPSVKESILQSTQSSDVENVSVGESKPAELNYLKSLDDANADPKKFIYKLEASMPDSIQTVPSLASRNNIEDMNAFRHPVKIPRTLNMNDDDEEIKKRNEKTPSDEYSLPPKAMEVNAQLEETNMCETAEGIDKIEPDLFRGMTFALFAFSEEDMFEVLMEIEEAGGTMVGENDFKKTVDYLIVPIDTYDIGASQHRAKEIVTDLWIQECLSGNAIVDIKYYHRAILIATDCKPLLDLTIVISTYTTRERDFLYFLAQALGAVVNNCYMPQQKPVLICPTPHGYKYLEAVKRQLPVVTGEWLQECLKQRTKVPMNKFAILDRKRLNIVEKTNESNGKRQKLEKCDETADTTIYDPEELDGYSMTISPHPNVAPRRSVFSLPSFESLKAPPRSNAIAGSDVTPITVHHDVKWIEHKPNEFRSKFEEPRRFGLGATTINAELKQMIVALGAEVCEDTSIFDPTCTHLICSELSQSEKIFSMIASGRWLLSPSYIKDSYKAGHLLDEEEYEWGNPKAESDLPKEMNRQTRKFARVNHRWRVELKLRSEREKRKVGIFSGIRAILHTHRKDSFKRLLEAGCGVVVDIKQPYTKQADLQGITHCFVDRRMTQLSNDERRLLCSAGIHTVSMMFLQECVKQNSMPNVEDFEVQ